MDAPTPRPPVVKRTYYLPAPLAEALRTLAFEHRRSQNDIVVTAVTNYLASFVKN